MGDARLIGEFGTPNILDPINFGALALGVIIVAAWATSERQVPPVEIVFVLGAVVLGSITTDQFPLRRSP